MRLGALAFAATLSACAGARASAPLSRAVALRGTDGVSHDLRAEVAQAPATVLVFFQPHCPCMAAHEPRLRALYDELHPKGVQWFLVDSEAGGTLARDTAFVVDRRYDFPMLRDDRSVLAKALGADVATFSVVLDREGHVRYAGGIDDDRTHLRDVARPYLRDAVMAVVAGKPVERQSGKALGCALDLD
jgi:hypothetical protein